jgi:hypothetical protein
LAIAKLPDDVDARTRLALRHYKLFDMGLNQTHLDVVGSHFVDALEDSWVEQDVIDDVMRCLGSFRFIHTITHEETDGQTEIKKRDRRTSCPTPTKKSVRQEKIKRRATWKSSTNSSLLKL